LSNEWPDILPKIELEENTPRVSIRPAQLCPGCGHRSAFYAIKKALDKDDITVADIGCHTLGFLPPYEMGQVLLSMGHSVGTASGLSLFNEERKVVAFLGDSTLFHAGLPGIVNALFNNHNVTLVIMENGTTAMTGHQNHPGSGHNFNEVTDKIPIKKMLEGFGVENVREVDAYSQAKLYQMVKESTKEKGFSVIIAKHPCMLKLTREQRRKGTYRDHKVYIDQKVCDHSYVCVEDFACPSFQKDENGDIHVHPDLCIGDGSCIQTCPVTAIKHEKM
jgi:indolepyruvate ferredoxin oxidoreductase alpha subunit